jgi:hypothetical protein
MSLTRVVNLGTGEEKFYSLSPRKAVIAAYAQDSKDWNTFDYESKYSKLVVDGRFSYRAGAWCAVKIVRVKR